MIKKIFVILAIVGLMIPSFAFAADFGLDDAAKGTALENFKNTNTDIPSLIGSIVGVALSFLGAIFFLLILYAGFLWMTAFGSSEKADKAKSILEHAAVGLVIVLAAYAISRFVFSALKVGEGTSGGSSNQTTSMVPGTTCGNGDNTVWNNSGTCVEECAYKYPPASGNGVCEPQSVCEVSGGTSKAGLCSGGASIICCI